jgi:phosphoribosylglycinamide formyltransferase-1
MKQSLKTTVLISGGGSNLQALIDARDSGRLEIDITHVISNVADAAGLDRAARAGISSSVLPHGNFSSREEFDRALAVLIAANQPDLVVLAGFMRIIGQAVLEPFQGMLINLHPSLLPLYRGTGTYAKAIEAGDGHHGASIHFVTEELDGGPVISQVVIPIKNDDSPESLAARLSPREHDLVVATVELFSRHQVECSEGSVFIDGKKCSAPLMLQPDNQLHP